MLHASINLLYLRGNHMAHLGTNRFCHTQHHSNAPTKVPVVYNFTTLDAYLHELYPFSEQHLDRIGLEFQLQRLAQQCQHYGPIPRQSCTCSCAFLHGMQCLGPQLNFSMHAIPDTPWSSAATCIANCWVSEILVLIRCVVHCMVQWQARVSACFHVEISQYDLCYHVIAQLVT